MSLTPDMVVAKYVELRDEVKRLNDAHVEAMKPYNDKMERLEAWLLDFLNRTKQESARTEAGTAYKNHVLSVQVEDWDTVIGMVVSRAIARGLAAVENGGSEKDAAIAFCASPELNFLVRGVSKTAVVEHMEAHQGQPPPGVKTAQILKIGVRRA